MATLKAYRRARSLCFTYGERWGHDHRCGPTVQLHVVEELLDMMRTNQEEAMAATAAISEPAANCCVISKEAIEGAESPMTIRLHGWVQGREVIMLVDSGSSHSFVCASLADHLKGLQPAKHPLKVRVANGGEMHSDQEIPSCQWSTHGV